MTGFLSQHGGQAVARVPNAGLRGFLPAFASALREGVPVELLDGLTSLSNHRQMLVTRSVEDRRKILRANQASLRQERGNFERQIARSTDETVMDRWADRADGATRKLAEIAEQLQSLQDSADVEQLQDVFDGEVGFLLTAVAAMAAPDALHEREAVQALDSIVTDRRIVILADGRVQWSATARLPVNGGVASLGPITWIPDEQPELTVALMWCALEIAGARAPWMAQLYPVLPALKERPTLSESARHHFRGDLTLLQQSRRAMDERLSEIGLAPNMVKNLLAVPFPAAAEVVLAVHHQADPPRWVGEQWLERAWATWLHRQYTTPQNWGRTGVWAEPSWLRQAVVDITVDHGGSITTRDLLTALAPQNLDYTELQRIMKPGGVTASKTDTTRPWLFPLTRIGTWPGPGQSVPRDSWGFEVVLCPTCGEVADIATRALELAGDLLCPNRHLANVVGTDPAAEHVVAPEEYLWLRVPRDMWRVRSRRRGGPVSEAIAKPGRKVKERRPEPAPRPPNIRERVHEAIVGAGSAGLTAKEVTALLGLEGRQAATPIHSLVKAGLVEPWPHGLTKTSSTGKWAQRWVAT